MARSTTPTRPRATVISLVASFAAVASLSACGSDGLVPDVTTGGTETHTPNTDTRTVDPPTMSNLPITTP
jgi:hypothetical protein